MFIIITKLRVKKEEEERNLWRKQNEKIYVILFGKDKVCFNSHLLVEKIIRSLSMYSD